LLSIVAGLEGHPDNAAAAVHGGLVLIDGLHYTPLILDPDLRFLAAIPAEPLRTSEARAALPDVVTRDIVVRSLARFGFLLAGLQSGDPTQLARARGDELHEGPRASLAPLSGRLISIALDAGAMHASWSGAGPSVLAITAGGGVEVVAEVLRDALDGAGTVVELRVAYDGWS
jgi:homoserine kinase